jgi:hypothetical protein
MLGALMFDVRQLFIRNGLMTATQIPYDSDREKSLPTRRVMDSLRE